MDRKETEQKADDRGWLHWLGRLIARKCNCIMVPRQWEDTAWMNRNEWRHLSRGHVGTSWDSGYYRGKYEEADLWWRQLKLGRLSNDRKPTAEVSHTRREQP